MAAKGMISRGFSKVEEARKLLRRLDTLLDGRKVFLQWVKSELNPADAPSRDDSETFSVKNLELWSNLKTKLSLALPMARTLWVRQGRNTVQELPRNDDARRRERQ